MKKIKQFLIVFLTLSASLSQAGLMDRYWDRGLDVHRLQVGETRVIKGLIVVCVQNLEDVISYAGKPKVYYMNALSEPVRDRIPGVSLYCGNGKDRRSHDTRQEVAKLFQLACVVDMDEASNNVSLTIFDKQAGVTTDRFYFPGSQLEAANSACMKNQELELCFCRPLPGYLVQQSK